MKQDILNDIVQNTDVNVPIIDAQTRQRIKQTASCCSLNYWQTYFNFGQTEILGRLLKAVTLQKMGDLVFKDPDLYNPVWIDVTLCFVLGIFGNLNQLLELPSDKEYSFNYSLVVKAFTVVLGLGSLVPLMILLFFWFFGIQPSFRNAVGIFSIYNYSNVFFILGSVVIVVPLWKFD